MGEADKDKTEAEVKEEVKDEGLEIVKLLGETLVKKDDTGASEKLATKDLSECEVVGIYFSAHWCPPCRGFTPVLAETYKALVDAGKKFEIVFVSSDRDDDSFQDYYKSMPWAALPFDDRARKGDLATKFSVRGIPRLLLIDPKSCDVTNSNARGDVMGDTKGEKFPWKK